MTKHTQSLCKSMGDYGCYFLCLVEIAERASGRKIDIIKAAVECSERKTNGRQWLALNWDNLSDTDNFTVNNPAAILGLLTGKKWDFKRVDAPTYEPKPGEYVVQHWHNKRTGYGHFRMADFDSLQSSVTVREGKIDSFRVFREVG